MGRWAARCRQVVPGGAVSWLGGAAARKPKRIREELGGPHFKTRRLCKRRPSRLLVASVTKSGIGWHHSSSRRSYANSRDDLACKYKCSKDVQDVSVILSQHPTPQDMSSSLQLQINWPYSTSSSDPTVAPFVDFLQRRECKSRLRIPPCQGSLMQNKAVYISGDPSFPNESSTLRRRLYASSPWYFLYIFLCPSRKMNVLMVCLEHC